MTWSRKKWFAVIALPALGTLAFAGGYRFGVRTGSTSLALDGPGGVIARAAHWAFLFADLSTAKGLVATSQTILARRRTGDYADRAVDEPTELFEETEKLFRRGLNFKTNLMLAVLAEEVQGPDSSEDMAKYRTAATAACLEGDALVSLSVARAQAALDGDPTEFCNKRLAPPGAKRDTPSRNTKNIDPPTQTECETLVAKKVNDARAQRGASVSSPK